MDKSKKCICFCRVSTLGQDLIQQQNSIIQEAIKLVENEFFSNGIIRLTIRADVENEKSNNVAKKAGYTFEGTLRKSQYNMCMHEFRDINLYSKIKE